MSLAAFDANAFSLSPGIRLLEASAGTGKTFALAHLVLRLLSEGARPLEVEEVLVVTFTDAAAAELRDRIARRLQEALVLLDAENAEADEPLQQWRSALDAEQVLRIKGRLLLALERLDRADITTIHGFCRRTLQRHALEAGLGPDVALESQGRERRQQLVHDYWQQQVLPLPPHLVAGLQSQQVTPDQLVNLLGSLDGDPALQLAPLPEGWSSALNLAEQLGPHWNASWEQFRSAWEARSEALEQDFAAAAVELKSLGVDYKPYRLKAKPDRLNRVQTWLSQLDAPAGYSAVLQQEDLKKYFHPGPFTKAAAPAHGDQVSLPQAPLLRAIAAVVEGPAELALLHFCHWGRAELQRRRARSGEISFGQLLEQLDPGRDATAASALLRAVSHRYRAALIDEFQDTDPIQWRILKRAFAQEPSRHLLVMVGDPKQAIYRFRGGELQTYRQAAEEADGRFGLFENRRSSSELVASLNALMRPGLIQSGLEVPAVLAKASKGSLELPGSPAPLQLLELDPSQSPEAQVAGLCQDLLSQGLQLNTADRSRPINPGDICLLVSRHDQAEALRAALERRQIPSRLVSRGDVFESLGASALQRFLDALAQPGQLGRLKLLAASALLGWSAAEIEASSSAQWDQLTAELSTLAARLPKLGLTAALAHLQGTEGLARLSLRGRALADVQQAAELVQEQMHRQGLGAQAAADWLRRLRLEENRDTPEAHLCRSDAAEAAIAVVTVHRSKGLEYPLVICPYLWKAPKAAKRLGRRWTADGQPQLDLHLQTHWGVGRLAAQQDLQAQIAEAERLAYVACTRAQHLLVLGWPGPDQADTGNPLSGWLLEGDQERELPLERIQASGEISQPWQPAPEEGQLGLGPRPKRSLDSSWGRASYSAWAHSQVSLPPEVQEEGRDTDALSDGFEEALLEESSAASGAASWPDLGPLAHFPRGSGPGDALHRILERLDYGAVSRGERQDADAVIEQELQRAGLEGDACDGLFEALQQLMQTPLGGPLGPCRLGDLQAGSWLNEMNFDLPLATQGGEVRVVRSSGLAQAFAQNPGGRFGASYAKTLQGLEVASRGFLTGSIDLLFCWEGRWWVADWKSNWLGQRDRLGSVTRCGPNDYSESAMETLMARSHYPLQAHLYLVALHRYLLWRLPNYNPGQHLGGYAYVFLRGVPGPTPDPKAPTPGVLVDQPSLKRVMALDELLREGQP